MSQAAVSRILPRVWCAMIGFSLMTHPPAFPAQYEREHIDLEEISG